MEDGGSIHCRGRANGRWSQGRSLSGWHPVDLSAQVINALVDRTGADPAAIDDVIMGCVGPGRRTGGQHRRNAVLASAAGKRAGHRSTASAAPRSRRCISPRRR